MATAQKRIVVTLLCCLLGLAASAEGAGAWVLWMEDTTVRRSDWILSAAYATQAECAVYLPLKAAQIADAYRETTGGDVRVDGNVVSIMRLSKETVITRLLCLPDTVDPRGPKEGK